MSFTKPDDVAYHTFVSPHLLPHILLNLAENGKLSSLLQHMPMHAPMLACIHGVCLLVWLKLHVHVLFAALTEECGLHQGALDDAHLWTHLQSLHSHLGAMLDHMWACQ